MLNVINVEMGWICTYVKIEVKKGQFYVANEKDVKPLKA